MATGRTVSKYVNFVISDSGGTLRDIPIDGFSVCGITYEEQDVTAFQDAVRGALPNMPDAPIDIHGPFDTTAAQAASGSAVAPALSGSHIVLSALNGVATTVSSSMPSTLDLQFGIRGTYTDGDPQFGISGSTGGNGYICTKYTVNDDLTYDARFVLFPGSAIPAWGVAVET